jgi:hypothetical protein
VFVDDLDLNVSVAEEVGMVGVVHTEPARTLARLSELFRIAAVDPGD